MLPDIRYKDRIYKSTHISFGGYQHIPGAMNGAIWDMQNMSSDDAPLLRPRKKRWKTGHIAKPNGFLFDGDLFYVDGTGFYVNGEQKGIVKDSPKKLARLGNQVFIIPDWKYYDVDTGEFSPVGFEEKVYKAKTVKKSTYEDAREGYLRITNVPESETPFVEKISDCYKSVEWDNVMCFHAVVDLVIDGVLDGHTVHFEISELPVRWSRQGGRLDMYTGAWNKLSGITADVNNAVVRLRESIRYKDYDFLFTSENRMWLGTGKTVMASTVDSCFEWGLISPLAEYPKKTYIFENDGTLENINDNNPWQGTMNAGGDFAAGVYYKGYPTFTKEGNMVRAYGSSPLTFQLVDTVSAGSAEGSAKSLCTVGETLYYLTPKGVVAYGGGIFQNVSAALGNVRYKNAVAGSDGRKYYISMQDDTDSWHLFVYDTTNGLWEREDDTHALAFWYDKGLYMVGANGDILLNGGADYIPAGAEEEAAVESLVEFADFIESSNAKGTSYGQPNKKGVSKIQTRIEVGDHGRVTIEIMYDSSGEWETVTTLTATVKRSFYLPIIPHRCDHFRLRYSSDGDWRLNSLVFESYTGSEM